MDRSKHINGNISTKFNVQESENKRIFNQISEYEEKYKSCKNSNMEANRRINHIEQEFGE